MVQEVTPPPKSLGCDPALRCGEKNNKKKKKSALQKHSLLPLILSTAVAAVSF